MHGDEEDLEAAGEETQHEQHVAGMAARLGERLRRRLPGQRGRRRRPPALRGEASASDSGMMSSTSAAKISSVSCQP